MQSNLNYIIFATLDFLQKSVCRLFLDYLRIQDILVLYPKVNIRNLFLDTMDLYGHRMVWPLSSPRLFTYTASTPANMKPSSDVLSIAVNSSHVSLYLLPSMCYIPYFPSASICNRVSITLISNNKAIWHSAS